MRKIAIIEVEDARRYAKSLRWTLATLERAFERTEDMSLRKTINKHGPVLEELLDELKQR